MSHPLRLDNFSAGDPHAESSRRLLLLLLRGGPKRLLRHCRKRLLLHVRLLLRGGRAEPLLLQGSTPESTPHPHPPPPEAPPSEGHRRDARRIGLRARSSLLPEGPQLLLRGSTRESSSVPAPEGGADLA